MSDPCRNGHKGQDSAGASGIGSLRNEDNLNDTTTVASAATIATNLLIQNTVSIQKYYDFTKILVEKDIQSKDLKTKVYKT